MEVLISPLQSLDSKDEAAVLIVQMGEISSMPALRSYAGREKTRAGRVALLMLEEKVGR